MCIRDRIEIARRSELLGARISAGSGLDSSSVSLNALSSELEASLAPVSYTHLRAHETVLDLVCRLLLETKNNKNNTYPPAHTVRQQQIS